MKGKCATLFERIPGQGQSLWREISDEGDDNLTDLDNLVEEVVMEVEPNCVLVVLSVPLERVKEGVGSWKYFRNNVQSNGGVKVWVLPSIWWKHRGKSFRCTCW